MALNFSWYNLSYPITAVSFDNSSAPTKWNLSAGFTFTVCFLVIILNCAVLFCFVNDRDLRKEPFCVYLMCLLISNIMYAVLENPFEILTRVRSIWSFGVTCCIIYKYALSFVFNMQMFSHVLISISRLWAVTFPHSYRLQHTWKCAIALCAAMFVYVHLVHLPRFIPFVAAIRLPLEIYGCSRQYGPNIVQAFLTFIPALGIVVVAYPFIVYKRQKRLRSKNKVSPATATVKLSTKDVSARETISEVPSRRGERKMKRSSQSFLVLTLMTCSNLILWAPSIISFAVDYFIPLPYPLLFRVVITIVAIQPVLDPILFTIAIKDLRLKFVDTFCCARR